MLTIYILLSLNLVVLFNIFSHSRGNLFVLLHILGCIFGDQRIVLQGVAVEGSGGCQVGVGEGVDGVDLRHQPYRLPVDHDLPRGEGQPQGHVKQLGMAVEQIGVDPPQVGCEEGAGSQVDGRFTGQKPIQKDRGGV